MELFEHEEIHYPFLLPVEKHSSIAECMDILIDKYPEMNVELATLRLGIELIWRELFDRTAKDYGLVLGAWLAGYLVKLEE